MDVYLTRQKPRRNSSSKHRGDEEIYRGHLRFGVWLSLREAERAIPIHGAGSTLQRREN